MAQKPEARLKAAVIDRLYEKRFVDDTSVLISEMVVDNWSRRADVVLANGKLWGFEIKSEADSLSRLPGQIDTFSRTFEKLTIVVASKFESQAKAMLPEGVGLWVEVSGQLVEKVRPRASLLTKEAALRLMTVTELRSFLVCNGITNTSGMSRARLVSVALGFPQSDLAAAARDAVKRRFRANHQNFESFREGASTMAALSALRPWRSKLASEDVPDSSSDEAVGYTNIPAGHPAIVRAPAGLTLKRLPRG